MGHYTIWWCDHKPFGRHEVQYDARWNSYRPDRMARLWYNDLGMNWEYDRDMPWGVHAAVRTPRGEIRVYTMRSILVPTDTSELVRSAVEKKWLLSGDVPNRDDLPFSEWPKRFQHQKQKED